MSGIVGNGFMGRGGGLLCVPYNFEKYLQFDGTDDYYLLNNPSAINLNADFSLSFWMIVDKSASFGGTRNFIWSGTSTVSLFSIRMTVSGSFGQVIDIRAIFTKPGGGNVSILSGIIYRDPLITPFPGQNYVLNHICVTRDSANNTFNLYVNGTLKGSVVQSHVSGDLNTNTYIGRREGGGEPYNMGIDEWYWTKTLMTADDVASVWNNGCGSADYFNSLLTADFYHYYRYNEIVNTNEIADLSGNGNNVTLLNFVTNPLVVTPPQT